jgi:hypothetical protein
VAIRHHPLNSAEADAPQEPSSLDNLIAETQDLLPVLETVTPEELRTIARKLRTLASYAEAWAQRMDTSD